MEASPDIHSVISNLRNRVLLAFPDLNIVSSRLISTGWDSHVLLVNDRFAFKFPIIAEDEARLRKEVKVLKVLADSPVQLPHYSYIFSDSAGFFGGYQYINGDALNTVSSLTEKMKSQLSDFLNYLFQKTGHVVESGALPRDNEHVWRDRYRKLLRDLRENFKDILGPDLITQLEQIFRPFLVDYTTNLETAVIHGDLYRGNVLIDREKGDISGIIDWGECSIGDPAIDFAALAVDFSVSDINEILRTYVGTLDGSFLRRMEFYWRIEPLYGLMYSVKKGDESGLQTSKNNLLRRMSSGLF